MHSSGVNPKIKESSVALCENAVRKERCKREVREGVNQQQTTSHEKPDQDRREKTKSALLRGKRCMPQAKTSSCKMDKLG